MQEAGNFAHGYALLVGIGGPDLPNTIDDARHLGAILTDPERCGYQKDHVNVLLGESATRQTILDSLSNFSRIEDPQATVIVFFSGHGYRVTASMGEAYYILPHGADLKQLYKTAIRGDEFSRSLEAIPARKLLVLLDCCHAGGFTSTPDQEMQLAKSPLPPEARQIFEQGKGKVLIASSREDELSFGGKPFSAFTLAIMESLGGLDVAQKDGYVRVSDLALHASNVVPARTGNRQHPTLVFHEADSFVIAYYAGGDMQPKGLPFEGEPQIEPMPGAWAGRQDFRQVQVGDIRDVRDSNINIAAGDIIQTNSRQVNTSGGSYFEGPIQTNGGDFVMGSKHIQASQGGIAIGGNVQDSHLQTGRPIPEDQRSPKDEFQNRLASIQSAISQSESDPAILHEVLDDLAVAQSEIRKHKPNQFIILKRLTSILDTFTNMSANSTPSTDLIGMLQSAILEARRLFT